MDAESPIPAIDGAMEEMLGELGRELPMERFHANLRRVAVATGGSDRGTCLVSCADEYCGELRNGFDRDVARPLMAQTILGGRQVFAVSNLGGRLEQGALQLVDDHYTHAVAEDPKTLVIEIAAHVGRRKQGDGWVYGELERLGRHSACCGALATLIDGASGTAGPPWLKELKAGFGPARLSGLRSDSSSYGMVRAAAVHAVLQAESAIAELIREPPRRPTHILVAPVVAVHHSQSDGILCAGLHHLMSDGERLEVVGGNSLRSTPEALHVSLESDLLSIVSDGDYVRPVPARAPTESKELEHVVQQELESLVGSDPGTPAQVENITEQIEVARTDPAKWRVYSRPLLRGLIQALAVAAPGVGVAALAFEGGHATFRAHRLSRLVASGPSSEEARATLYDIEREIQQLGHRDAQEVLDLLMAERGPLISHTAQRATANEE